MKKFILTALYCVCASFIVYVAGVSSAYFGWPIAQTISRNLEMLAQRAEYAGIAKQDFSFDESVLAKNQIPEAIAVKSERYYTLLSIRYNDKVYALDENNKIVHIWHIPYRTAFPTFKSDARPPLMSIDFEKAIVFPNGDLIGTYTGRGDTPYGYGLVKIDKDSHVLWTYADNTHHDVMADPATGIVYTLTQQFADAAAYPTMNLPGKVLADYITLLTADGALIKKISVADAFANSEFAALLFSQSRTINWDRLHTNSIDIITPNNAAVFPAFKPGYILISIRNLNTLAVIDPESEKVVWAYNGRWDGQHSAHFTDRGTIVFMDNRGGGSLQKPQSRILELNPTTLALSVRFEGNKQHPFYSCAYGRVGQLGNDHLLVTETLGSRLFEIDPQGAIIWQYHLKPYYQPRVRDIAPYGNNEKKYDPDFICASPNLATAIVYAERYLPQQLPFLAEKLQ